ncbi:hypothetical protein B2G71_23310 [Novosphingobium sp. PC22D]|uniref:hypothetical protein n=1 Tax=Novosphingobium sp. PC22D TaxID=1962403 RepID=UPI000BEFDA10|nr:hypothetical protein [Novosphingobium sp. PC22D]PEQ10263.1 hypothetical protein B2G71_23310 [Novosphingobium sp. PC22D]
MTVGTKPDLARQFAAALDWWREAGVDCDFADAPAPWLAAPADDAGTEGAGDMRGGGQSETPRVRAPADRPAAAMLEPEALPKDFAAFRDWWLSEPALDEGRTGRRVPPRGEAKARLMVLVPEPEREDRETLLSGPEGTLLAAIAEAMGLAANAIYVASVLPRHTPGIDWRGADLAPLAQVAAHHIALAAPQRLLVLGFNILPLLGHELPQRAAVLRSFNQEGMTIPMLAARGLGGMSDRPAWKAALWKAWLEWGSDDTAHEAG